MGQTLLNRDTAATISGQIPTYADLSAGLRTAWAPEGSTSPPPSPTTSSSATTARGSGATTPRVGVRVGSTPTHQFTLAVDGRKTDQGNPIASLTFVTRTVPGGWTFEVAVPTTALGLTTLTANQTFPFTFGLWDDDLRTYPGQTH